MVKEGDAFIALHEVPACRRVLWVLIMKMSAMLSIEAAVQSHIMVAYAYLVPSLVLSVVSTTSHYNLDFKVGSVDPVQGLLELSIAALLS